MNTDVTVVCEFSCLGCIQNRRRGLTGECFCTGLLKTITECFLMTLMNYCLNIQIQEYSTLSADAS